MKKLILFFIGFVCLGTTDVVAQSKNGARLHMEQSTHNFGDVSRKGGDLVREFQFTNEGNAPLVIMRVITSCSCLKTSHPKRPVMPGESEQISITYEPHKSEPGAFNKVIRILSNSTTGEEVITVQGNSIDGERNRGLRRLLRGREKAEEQENKEK